MWVDVMLAALICYYVAGVKSKTRDVCSRAFWEGQLEATGGFEPPIGVLQTPALTTWLRRLKRIAWCRGGDSNSYSLAATAPSTLRVYQFHHLGPLAIKIALG